MSNLIHAELWKANLSKFDILNTFYDDNGADINEQIENIMQIRENLDQNLYYTIPQNDEGGEGGEGNEDDEDNVTGRTILGHLIWLYRCFDLSKDDVREHYCHENSQVQNEIYGCLNTIQSDIYRSFVNLIKNGFDTNKEMDNGQKLILPMTEILQIDGLRERRRKRFFKYLVENGTNLNKTNVWDGYLHHHNFKDMVEKWTLLKNMHRMIYTALDNIVEVDNSNLS